MKLGLKIIEINISVNKNILYCYLCIVQQPVAGELHHLILSNSYRSLQHYMHFVLLFVYRAAACYISIAPLDAL
jgi:hypothetical protein